MNKILFTFSLHVQLQLTVDSTGLGTVHVGIVDVHGTIIHTTCTTSTYYVLLVLRTVNLFRYVQYIDVEKMIISISKIITNYLNFKLHVMYV